MAPGRVTNTISLARELGVLDRLRIVPPPDIDLALLETVHTPDYIAAVQRGEPNQPYGLGTSDNPIFPGMHEIAAAVTMASVEAARRVWSGDAQRACNISGGLHHAMPGLYQRLLCLQRRSRCHPLVAGERLRAGWVRRRRRSPRRRRPGDLL